MRQAFIAAAALLIACDGQAPTDDVNTQVCDTQTTEVYLINQIALVGSEGGITQGFDLDQYNTTSAGESQGCGIPDLVDAEGRGGIDNMTANLLPILATGEGDQFPELLQNSIYNGRLLIAIEVGQDTFETGECPYLHVHRAEGLPLLGTDNQLLWDQTMSYHQTFPSAELPDAAWTGDSLEGQGFTVDLELRIIGYDVDMLLEQSMVRVIPQPDGTVRGVVGGSILIQPIIDILNEGAVLGPDNAVSAALPFFADMLPDENGDCTAISASLEFTAIPAYLSGDPVLGTP